MSAYLCSDDTLNALSTFYYMKSGKTDEERKSNILRAIRLTNKKSWYDQYKNDPKIDSYDFRCELHSKFDKFCDGLFDIWFYQYSEESIYKVIFNILLRENQNSLMARYNDKDFSERPSYIYRMSNVVNYWDDHNQLGYLVGIINNYDYQSCEHVDYTTSLGYAILDQIKELLLRELQLGEIWDFNESRFIQENKLFQPIS